VSKFTFKVVKNIKQWEEVYLNCEVMLSKHGLYPKTGGALLPNSKVSALDIILWLLYYSDGSMSLYEISKKLNINISLVYNEAKRLEEKNIILKCL